MTATLYDWHDVHDDSCPQNDPNKIDQDCNCKEPVKRKRKPDLVNRNLVRRLLLEETNSRQKVRIFTQVYPTTINEISAMVKREIIRRAENPPRKGKSI